jgi:DUF1680 family protein
MSFHLPTLFAALATAMPLAAAEVRLDVEPFDLADVKLLDGPFRHAQELDRKYLLSLPTDRLLHAFRRNAGLPSAATPLGGWEEPKCDLRGHFVGHYLSACALMVRSTGDQALRAKADAVVAGMAECQARFPSGYLSAFPESLLDRVESGKPVWAPWYTLHKIYAGLLDMHVLTGNRQALKVVRGACDWVIERTARLSDAQMQRMLNVEHGGMNEVLANLAGVTGEAKYLAAARRFNHLAVLEPLMRREDKLTGLHANTQFPKVIGLARQYELTGNERYRTAATFFWEVVTRERSYVTGSNSRDEHFSPKEKLSEALSAQTGESCNTYNMLKLTRHLFQWHARGEYADYYERALWNHILASQDPRTGMMAYMLPLAAGCARGDDPNHLGLCKPLDSFWCCTGTGVENHAKYADSIYFHRDASDLFVTQFIPSRLHWKQQKTLIVRQETRFPDEPRVRIHIDDFADPPRELTVHVRHPRWAVEGMTVRINGQAQQISSRPGEFAPLRRVWRHDVIDVELPMPLRTEGFRDNPRRLALLCGPIVLCAATERGNRAAAILAEPGRVLEQVKRVAGRPLTFTAPGTVFRRSFDGVRDEVRLTPFFREFDQPTIVYWDVLDEKQWNDRVARHKAQQAREAAFKARLVDQVEFEPASERAHGLKGERTGSGTFNDHRWRHASGGGWFSVDLKVLADRPMELVCTYWGGDAGRREFDVLVDNVRLATVKLDHNRPGEFYDAAYRLPAERTQGKQRITVRFQAHSGQTAGGVFGVRTLRAGP